MVAATDRGIHAEIPPWSPLSALVELSVLTDSNEFSHRSPNPRRPQLLENSHLRAATYFSSRFVLPYSLGGASSSGSCQRTNETVLKLLNASSQLLFGPTTRIRSR